MQMFLKASNGIKTSSVLLVLCACEALRNEPFLEPTGPSGSVPHYIHELLVDNETVRMGPQLDSNPTTANAVLLMDSKPTRIDQTSFSKSF